MFKFLKKDNLWLGLLLGIIVPAATYGIFYLLNTYLFINSETGKSVFNDSTVLIISVVPNAAVLRYYLVKRKADKTGKGILFITFVFAIIYIILNIK